MGLNGEELGTGGVNTAEYEVCADVALIARRISGERDLESIERHQKSMD